MTSATLPARWLAVGLLALPLGTLAQQKPAPQLGKAPLAQVLAALTPEEKVQLVVGMGLLLPEGMDVPKELLPEQDPVDAKTPEKVPGSSGRTHGVPRLGIPSLTLTDGPAGVHINTTRPGSAKKYYPTAFPVATLLASSWDTTLVRRVGVAFGSEVRAYGLDVLLAPAMNIQRNPLGGRNFEYYAEDPVLSGSIAAALVRGVQANGVGTSIKHFAANNQEFNRKQLNSHISERALRELYLRNFRVALAQSKPWTLMSSYNKINGTYTSESPDLLTTLLRQEWGFGGLVMSDWFGGQSAVAQIKAGNNLLMPGAPTQTRELLAALKSGALSPKDLDASVLRVLELVLKSPTFRRLPTSDAPDLKADAAVARQAAAESLVLLRNEAQALPLPAGQAVALFGNTSYDLIAGGTGSGAVNKAYTVSVAQGLAAQGFGVDKGLAERYDHYLKTEKAAHPQSQQLFASPVVISELALDASALAQLARTSGVAVVTLGRNGGEGGDRQEASDFALRPDEQALLQQVSAAFHAQGKKMVVVLNVGGVTEVASWRAQADAILLAWQPGQEGGHAVADVLSGRVNPSGKLATTFPVKYADVPYAASFPGRETDPTAPHKPVDFLEGRPAENTYEEGIYVGYRYYNTFKVQPAYAFGYGLSYTTFAYGPLKLSAATFGSKLTATLTVTNTGAVAGKEVVQLYVSAPQGKLDKPESELKAFAKTALLAPGKSQTLTFSLSAADLASYSTAASAWVADAGTYTVRAGASSLNTRQQTVFQLPKLLVVEKSRPLLAPASAITELRAQQ